MAPCISVDSGRLVFDQNFDLVVEHGHYPVFFEDIDICGLLAS